MENCTAVGKACKALFRPTPGINKPWVDHFLQLSCNSETVAMPASENYAAAFLAGTVADFLHTMVKTSECPRPFSANQLVRPPQWSNLGNVHHTAQRLNSWFEHHTGQNRGNPAHLSMPNEIAGPQQWSNLGNVQHTSQRITRWPDPWTYMYIGPWPDLHNGLSSAPADGSQIYMRDWTGCRQPIVSNGSKLKQSPSLAGPLRHDSHLTQRPDSSRDGGQNGSLRLHAQPASTFQQN